MKKIILALLTILFFIPLHATMLPPTVLQVEGGGRFDQVRFDFEASGFEAKYHFDDIRSWEMGLRGRWDLSTYWYLRGNVTYGNIISGTCNINSVESPALLQTGSMKGHMLDVQAALGRFFTFTDWLALAPVFGWGYDGQYIWTKSMGSKYSFKEMQNGPFIGADFHTQWTKRFSLDFGYEIHFTSSRAKVEYQPLTDLDMIRGHSKVTFGQVGWIQALYYLGCHWQLGLRGELVSYSTTKAGRVVPDNQGIVYSGAQCREISWQSAQLSLLVGYTF